MRLPLRARRPRAPINGLALDAWIIFDIALDPVVTGLRRTAVASFATYVAIAVTERTLTEVGAAFTFLGIGCTVVAYVLLVAHFHIGRRIHFRPPAR